MYSSLLFLRRSLDILYMVKSFVKKGNVIPPIVVGMIAFEDEDFVEDDEKQAEVSESEEVVVDVSPSDDDIDQDPDGDDVKDEPVGSDVDKEDPHVSVKIEPVGSNVDEGVDSDNGMVVDDPPDEEINDDSPEVGDEDDIDDRPSYKPYDPELTEYSTV